MNFADETEGGQGRGFGREVWVVILEIENEALSLDGHD